jgi:hypothetical protein
MRNESAGQPVDGPKLGVAGRPIAEEIAAPIHKARCCPVGG